ncbi:MAG: PP2C family protein-serine/threonine phosphatase, partial [Jatrophihabitantaceae bacterium]
EDRIYNAKDFDRTLVLDERTRLLQWGLAGHPPAMLRRAGSVRQLKGGLGTPIGVNGIGYVPASIQLEPGDLVLLYTDGLIERRDSGLRLDQLASWLAGSQLTSTAELVEQVADAMLPTIREDDAAVLAFALDPVGAR